MTVSAAVLSLHTSLQVLMAYETSILGWVVCLRPTEDMQRSKIVQAKKTGGAPENVLDNASLQGTPPKVLIDRD